MRFLPGLRLAETFYRGAVRPLLDEHFPGLPHAAALIGYGSEVLGFDTARSTDHNWGPRLQIFLPTEENATDIGAVLAAGLPDTWSGYPTAFTFTQEADQVPRQRVEVACLADWLTGWLGFDPTAGVTVTDWLATPTQRLAEVTQGAVYHDGFGELTAVRSALAWYPDDLWRYVLACQWQRIGQEEAFPGRCAEVGDELGSLVITARLARDIMRLCLLMHRRYPPYSKWLGTAFARLPGIGDLPAQLAGALTAHDWPAREDHLVTAYRAIVLLHNELGLTEPLSPDAQPFYDRPIRIIGAARFRDALMAGIKNPGPLAGAVDQFVDSTDALGNTEFTRAVAAQWT